MIQTISECISHRKKVIICGEVNSLASCGDSKYCFPTSQFFLVPQKKLEVFSTDLPSCHRALGVRDSVQALGKRAAENDQSL